MAKGGEGDEIGKKMFSAKIYLLGDSGIPENSTWDGTKTKKRGGGTFNLEINQIQLFTGGSSSRR